MPTAGEDDAGLVRAVDELYALPPEDFTARRDDLAKAARASGDRTLAAAVRRLRRPTTSAWALNLLSRREADLVGQLVALGESLREAQAGLDGAALRELDKQRRTVVGALAARAGELAAERGHALDAALARQVEQSLGAAMADPDAGAAVTSGQLTRPVSVVGFGMEVEADVVAVPTLVLVGTSHRRRTARAGGGGGSGGGASSGVGARSRGGTRQPAGPATDGAVEPLSRARARRERERREGEQGQERREQEREGQERQERQREGRERKEQAEREREERERREQAEREKRQARAKAALEAAQAAESEAESSAQEAHAQVAGLQERLDELAVEREELLARLADCDERTAGTTAELTDVEQRQHEADRLLAAARRATRRAERQVEQAAPP